LPGDFLLGPWLVQPRLNGISAEGITRHVEPKMMQVLVCLAAQQGEVVSKDRLMRTVWPDTFVTDDALLRCISELRKALEDDAKEPKYIQTIPKSGYRLVAEVQSVERGAPEGRWPVWVLGLAAVGSLAVLLVAGYLIRRAFWLPTPVMAKKTMLAVLPLQDLGGDAEQEYFSEGLTEEMITQLAHLQADRLGVIARTSAMQYKNTKKSVEQIGRELAADYLLEGTVRHEGQRVRVTAQLIRVRDQTHVWAEGYDRELSGILSVQSEVARAIAEQIHLTLAPPTVRELAIPRSVNPEAYAAFLKGRYYIYRLTAEALEMATEHFRRAVELDPSFARAWLGLADSYRFRGTWWGDLSPRQAFPVANEALAEALKRDNRLGEAYASRGWVRFAYEWNFPAAEADFRRGLELSPNSAGPPSGYGNFLRCMKRYEESRVQMERALAIDPMDPVNLADASALYHLMGQPAKAEALARRALEVDPAFPHGNWGLAMAYANANRADQAVKLLEKGLASPHPDMLGMMLLGRLYGQAGKTAEARKVLKTMMRHSTAGHSMIAEVYARLGEKDRAIEWLEKGFAEREPYMVWLNLSPDSHPLWGDPRFQDILRRMNFPR